MRDHFADVRGPAVCPRPCAECPGRRHHWFVVTFPGFLSPGDDEYEEASRHPAVAEFMKGEGFVDYFRCKHCDAWHPLTRAMLDDDEFEFD
jgi:hypothetical protein